MKKTWLTLILAGCSFFPIGCIVKPAADTILTAEIDKGKGAEKFTFGVNEVEYYSHGDTHEIYGYGWHPREHETYAFIGCEGYPSYWPRYIRISPRNNVPKSEPPYLLEFIFETTSLCNNNLKKQSFAHFCIPISTPHKNGLGQMVVDLQHIRLQNIEKNTQPDEIILSGRIIAQKSKDFLAGSKTRWEAALKECKK